MGIGSTANFQIIAKYNHTKEIITPNKTQIRISFHDKFEEFQRNVIRRHIHSFWFQREILTVHKIYQMVSNDKSLSLILRTNIFYLLKEIDFRYLLKQSQNRALTEKSEIIFWRRRFLEDLRKYREMIDIYITLTWVNVGECTTKTWVDGTIKSSRDAILQGQTTCAVNSLGKVKRLIVLNIGLEGGFVSSDLLCFEIKKKKKIRDYHDEMNGDILYEWMESLLPRLKYNCVIIMDDASYHSVKIDKASTSQTKKAYIIK